MMYTNNFARLRINGHVGAPFRQTNGLRQGLPTSCILWNLYVEPFVRYLRDDARVRGLSIPGRMGEGTEELRVSAFADDIKRYCASVADVRRLLRPRDGPLAKWRQASRQIMSPGKFTVVLLGDTSDATVAELRAFYDGDIVRYGIDEADKNLGIRVGDDDQIAEQWYGKLRDMQQLAIDVAAGRRLGGSVYARSAIAKGAFGSKVYHSCRIQAPAPHLQRRILSKMQVILNKLVFGGYKGISMAQAHQDFCDGGVKHLDIAKRMQAEHAQIAQQLINADEAAWKNVWWHHLRKIYGALCDRDLLTGTCTFALLAQSRSPSNVQRAALVAWSRLHLVPVREEMPEVSPAMETRRRLAEYGREPPPCTRPVWKVALRVDRNGASVSHERLWFNACMRKVLADIKKLHPNATSAVERMHEPSTAATEREAVAWASAGLVRYRDILNGTVITGPTSFKHQFPALDSTLALGIRQYIPPPAGSPQGWHRHHMG